MDSNRLHIRLFWLTGALLLIVLSRLMLFPAMSFDQDEVWGVWLTFGNLQQVIARTDTNWSAWFNVMTYYWRLLAGHQPFVMRLLPLFFFMLNCAFSYQAGRKIYKNYAAALLVMLAYAGLGYMVFFSIYLRPYALLMSLVPLGLIFVTRYFEKPTFKRAVVLSLHMAFMFYVSIMAVFPFLIFGGVSLFLYGRKIWRWWLPGLMAAIVAIPEVLDHFALVSNRTAFEIDSRLPALPEALWGMFNEYFGPMLWLWLLLCGIALVFNLRSARQYRWFLFWLLVWAIGGTCLLYWIHPRTGLFRSRYAWWIAWSIPLWLGYGLAQLPKWGKYLAAVLLLSLSFMVSPERIAQYKEPIPDIESLFEWLQTHYEVGDVLVIDPNTQMASANFRAEVWDYYTLAFFPNGLHVVDRPLESYQRVWYLSTHQHLDTELQAQIVSGRLEGIFYGSPGFQIQLYEAPPNPTGIVFANGLRFHGVEVLNGEGLANQPFVMPKESELHLRLWWSVDEPLSQEYSVGIQIMSEQWPGIYAQSDAAPQAIYLMPYFNQTMPPFGSMTSWQPGQYYIEERIIELPAVPRLQRTPFTVYMTVYQWQDGLRIPAEGSTNADNLLPLFNFTLMAW